MDTLSVSDAHDNPSVVLPAAAANARRAARRAAQHAEAGSPERRHRDDASTFAGAVTGVQALTSEFLWVAGDEL